MNEKTSFLNRTLGRVRRAWSEISTSFISRDQLGLGPDLEGEDLAKLKDFIKDCLASTGEVSARKKAVTIGQAYLGFSTTGRERFFRLLSTEFDVDNSAVMLAIEKYQQAKAVDNVHKLRHELRKSLIAPRNELLTLFNALPEGIKFLVDMREELIKMKASKDKELSEVERDLKHLLRSWFDVGFLRLEQVTWDSPASLLEKLIEYEAVHEITSWDDLKNRLSTDRRLFAFFHPNMPDEPLIFIHVALVNGIATNVQSLLDTDAPEINVEKADTAIFYSISNAQQGLAGISFGNFLIKRVVAEVKKELPQLKNFATLSPVPGFSRWLMSAAPESDLQLSEEVQQAVAGIAQQAGVEANLKAILGIPQWYEHNTLNEVLKPVLLRLCAEYLSSQNPSKQKLLDPVAHFHISNGAILQQLNWMGDTSRKGFKQSFGLMVNYLYDLKEVDENSESYSVTHTARISNHVKTLLPDYSQE